MIRNRPATTPLRCAALTRVSAFTMLMLAVASAAPAMAGTDGPREVMTKTIDAAFAILRDRSLSGKERRAHRIDQLRRVADRTFEWSELARSSLGVKWRTLDAAQRAQFVDVFKDVLAAQYMDDIDRFQGTETVTVDSVVAEGDEAIVRTTLLTSSRERVPLDYRMRVIEGRWRVVDLSIEGISLVNHFRKTFTAALVNGSIEDLIVRLRRQLPATR